MITTGNWPEALEPIAHKGFDHGRKQPPAEKNMFFTVRNSKKFTETYLELGDIGPMGEFTGSVNYDDVSQGHKFTVSVTQYAKGIKIQRIFVDTDQLDIVEGLPELLGRKVFEREALDTFFWLNNAFNTSITTLDGLQICSSAHTSLNGGVNQVNRGTSPFSALSVEATRIKMKKFRTNKDGKIEMNPDTIVVPEDLFEAAWEVISSGGKVDTANNNANFHKGKYKLIHSVWLSDTNNWFMFDMDKIKKDNTWNDVTKPEFNRDKNFDDYVAKFSSYMANDRAIRNWRGIFGHEVS